MSTRELDYFEQVVADDQRRLNRVNHMHLKMTKVTVANLHTSLFESVRIIREADRENDGAVDNALDVLEAYFGGPGSAA